MKVVPRLLLVAVAWWLRQGGAPTVAGVCQNACGGVSVPYPFGLEAGCASSPEFLLHCNTTKGNGEQLLLGNIRVRKISPKDSTMVVSLPKVHECYNESGQPVNQSDDLVIDLSNWPQYTLSDTRNSLTVLGCDTHVLMSVKDGTFRSGCISYCNNSVELAKDTTCSGLGCCQASISKGLKKLRIRVNTFDGYVSVRQFNPCGVAFVGDKRSFDMSNWTLPNTQEDFGEKVDAVLDWMFGWDDVTSQQAQSSNRLSYACGGNTNRINYEDGAGYRCFCNKGYDGNPYDRNRGCQDIDECNEPEKYPCPGKCHNLQGSYKCERHRHFPAAIIAGIVGFAFVITFVVTASITRKRRTRKRNFKRNGGEDLKRAKVQIFTEAELAKATDNYNEGKKLDEDGFGSNYRGKLEGDAKVEITVKKPKDVHKPRMKKDFHHKLKTVMQISTKYVVKLQGICLETRMPFLVYEYVSNDSLFKRIHPKASIILRSWKNRLKIAAEAALALKNIHSYAIIHGNINSANILLDQNCSVKVSNVGTSVLVSPEHSPIAATEMEGMLGYIDPEYLKTGKLTVKSDVYSFGVVLMELLTGKKPTEYVTKSEEPMDIIPYFVSSVKDETLSSVIDFETNSEEMDEVKKVAKIATKCLDQSSRNRPKIGEVAQQLTAIDRSLIDEGENEGPTLEGKETTKISIKPSIPDEVIEQGPSSCLSYMGMDSTCPSWI